jgi:hypothetical protein
MTMQRSESPPLTPGDDVTVYLVLDDFGNLGRASEADEEKADKETVIRDLLCGQYTNPVRVVVISPVEGWSRDVSADIAREVAARSWGECQPLPSGTKWFVEHHLGERVGPFGKKPTQVTPAEA